MTPPHFSQLSASGMILGPPLSSDSLSAVKLVSTSLLSEAEMVLWGTFAQNLITVNPFNTPGEGCQEAYRQA